MNVIVVLMGVPLFCFASATVVEIRRDRRSLRKLTRILPLAFAAVASILLLTLLVVDLSSNLLNTMMSVSALLVAACGFLCRYKSRLAVVLIVVGGLLLAYAWEITRLRP
jgi:hypothetical protein